MRMEMKREKKFDEGKNKVNYKYITIDQQKCLRRWRRVDCKLHGGWCEVKLLPGKFSRSFCGFAESTYRTLIDFSEATHFPRFPALCHDNIDFPAGLLYREVENLVKTLFSCLSSQYPFIHFPLGVISPCIIDNGQ